MKMQRIFSAFMSLTLLALGIGVVPVADSAQSSTGTTRLIPVNGTTSPQTG